MTRKEFLKITALLGIGLPLQTSLSSCNRNKRGDFSGKVLIIGAGAAGMAAGHLLKQLDIDFEIIEAGTGYGGRLKVDKTFTDFPIPLGAEWLHASTDTFAEIVNDNSTSVNVNTIGYQSSDSYGLYENGNLTLDTLGNSDDRKFVGGSWLAFFEQYILPSLSGKMVFDQTVEAIDYSGDGVTVTTQTDTFQGDKVLVTVPLKIMQEGNIAFSPDLPASKVDAISSATVWDGLKVFFEFSSKFYPTLTDVTPPSGAEGEIVIFDAAYGQNTNKNILGFFAVGPASQPYISLSGNSLRDQILAEMDNIFSNQATSAYIQHISQNWSTAAHFKGAYLRDNERPNTVYKLFEPVNEKIYFAGEAYTRGNDWGSVHAAAEAARDAVDLIME